MKTILYNYYKDDSDFIDVYKKNNNGKVKGFKSFLKEQIRFFVDVYDIYLDKPYLDISWFKVNDKIVDIDLLWDVFMEGIDELQQVVN
jgi:transposase